MVKKIIQQVQKKSGNKDDRALTIALLLFSITANFVFISFNSETFITSRPIVFAFTIIEIITLIFAFLDILQPARIIFPFGGFVVVTILLFMGGIHDDAIGGYYLLLIFSTLLLGRKGLIFFGLLNTLAIIIIGYLETSGRIVTHFGPLTETSTIVTTAFFMVACSLTLYFFISRLKRMVEIARENEQEQIAANQELIKLQAILEKRVKERTSELQALFASMQDLVIVYNQEGRYLKILSASSNLLLALPEDFVGKTIHEFFPKEDADRFVRHIQKVLQTQTTISIEYSIQVNQRKVHFEASVSPLNENTVIWVARDITDRKLLEEGAHFIGTHDILTKLYNRTFFEEELSRLEKSRLFPVSVFMIDVDGLKIVNDKQGHAAGDEILKRTGKVLMKSFRSEDMVARIGGDEFVVLLPKTNEEAAQIAMDRINHFLKQNNKDNPMELRISIGIATTYDKGTVMAAMKQADERMYENKRSKR
jgi:diguanylate cyclase (GGDEF)-like protein/PAS domain S-box-containing protein